jgi:pimeloyl-ACP methyl ester carboxylesterase
MPIGVTEVLASAHGVNIAYQRSDGTGPTRVWLCGFRSDMGGTKAAWLHAQAEAQGAPFLRFDYRGCGQSGGAFQDGTIGRWLEDTLAVIDTVAQGPVVLVGSSMGGWLALLVARARPERVKGLMLIAPAPDFTERLMWPEMTEAARNEVIRNGVWMRPSAYDPTPTPITRALIEDGRTHQIMDSDIAFAGPVRIVHGQADPDVPWGLSLELAERLTSENLRLIFVKNGDHRLSTPGDLALLDATLDELCTGIAAG